MSEEPTAHHIIPLQLPRGTVRSRDDGYINILDLENLLPEHLKKRKSWFNFLTSAYDSIPTLARRNGLSPDAMYQSEDTADGEHFIWAHYDLALDYASYIDPNLRADILRTYRRARMGDPTLAAEILERSPETDEQRWIRARQELKGHTRLRNLAIKQHNGTGRIYSYCADELNKATTGRTKKEIRTIARVRDTRDALDTSHLALQLLGENEQIKAMDRADAQSNPAIQQAVDPVHNDIRGIALHFNLHNDHLLRDRSHLLQNHLQQARTALVSPNTDIALYPCRDYRGSSAYYPDAPSEAQLRLLIEQRQSPANPIW